MAINKPTSEMGSRKIASLINEELRQKNISDKNGKILSITKSTINTYLKKRHLKTRKIKKIFYFHLLRNKKNKGWNFVRIF
jgi:hypothetical protein